MPTPAPPSRVPAYGAQCCGKAVFVESPDYWREWARRTLAHPAADEFTYKFAAAVKALQVGDPTSRDIQARSTHVVVGL